MISALPTLFAIDRDLMAHFENGDVNGIRDVIVTNARAMADVLETAEECQALAVCDVALVSIHAMTRGTLILREMMKLGTQVSA